MFVGRVQNHFRRHTFLNKLVRTEKSQSCWKDEQDSCRAVVEKTMFAVCCYGQCPPPSRWQNVNATEHFVGGSFHWGVPRSTSGVRLTALHNNTPSLRRISHSLFVSLYLLPCSLLFTYFSSGLQCDFFPSHAHTQADTKTCKWLHKASPPQNTSSGPIFWNQWCFCSCLSPFLLSSLVVWCIATCGSTK